MKKSRTICLLAVLVTAPAAQAVLTTFGYTQTDSASGSGTIAPFSYDDGGGAINFAATPMPAASVFNPVPASTPVGFVGAMNAQSGNANEANASVGLLWSGFVTATGTRGASTYTIQIPLVYVPKQTQVPDTNDYNWSVAFGDGGGLDAVSPVAPRFAFYLSRDNIIDAVETPDTFQRFTQVTHNFIAGQDTFSNIDSTTTAIKDATDPAGAPTGNDAAGRDLAAYYGWRDQGSLSSGAILVDTFAFGGLVDANPATLQLVPEPGAAALSLLALLGAFRRRR